MLPTARRPRIHLLGALAGLVLLVAACSSSGGGSSAAASVAASAAASTGGAAASAGGAAQGSADVGVGNGAVGAFLTGKDGKTLYVFTSDSANKSTCTDQCATNWPPFTVPAGTTPNADSGVTGTLTTFARPDGTQQVAINGLPLYYFAKDTKAGDTNGQGVGGKWFVASPTGAMPSPAGSGAAPAAGSASPDATKAGY
jgi:predicted lipoprotein with Yx(FWY)xxD motif